MRSSITRRLAALALAIAPLAALADGYPSKAVTIVVPFPAGGATDVLARLVAQYLTDSLKQPFVVSNVGGASGAIAHEQVMRAAPDGHTLIVGTASTMAANAAYSPVRFDPVKDFTPVAMLTTEAMAVLVTNDAPVKSVADLVALAKSKPGTVTVASFGAGSISHFAAELFKLQSGADLLHVPYQGAGPAMTALIGGHVQAMFNTLSASVAPAQGGKVRMIAITDAKRKAFLPDVPTVAESGVPGYQAGTWLALFGPANLPKDVVAKLSAEIVKMMKSSEVREKLVKMSAEPASGTPAEAAEALARDLEKWRRTIRDAGIKRE